MSPSGIARLVAAMGLVLGGLSGGAAAYVLSRKQIASTGEPRGWRPVEIIIATSAVPAGGRIEASRLARKLVPEQFVEPSTLRASDARHVVGAHAVLPIAAGAVVRWYDVAEAYPDRACERLRAWAASPSPE